MKLAPHNDQEGRIRRQAAEWLVRRDRGLSAQESIEFELWLADDERHARALQRSRAAWAMLDRISETTAHTTVQRAASRRRVWRIAGWGSLAAAAALVLALAPLDRSPVSLPTDPILAAAASEWMSPQVMTLSDGSLVRLNAGSEVLEQFSADERRVLLVRGEAHFTVTKNLARPFIVRAGTVEARAVGTAFNVHLQSAAVEVLVTEGTVAVRDRGAHSATHGLGTEPAEATTSAAPSRSDFLLSAYQRAVVALAPVSTAAAVVVTDLSKLEVSRALAWQEPLLRLSGATLGELVGEFQRRTGYRLVISDPHLAGLRTGGRFRGDDVEGFLRILEDNFGIKSETSSDGVIMLSSVATSESK